MIKAVIFDMDGVLIDTEPLWRESKKTVFNTIGISLTEDLLRQTMGLRIDEVVEYVYNQFPWKGPSKKQIAELIAQNTLQLVKKEGKAKEGVMEALTFIKTLHLRLALASVVTMEMIDTILDKLNIRDFFEVTYSAEFEKYGKPHPGVYITTAEKLGLSPQVCVAIEDSINGMIAAKAAKMKSIAVPAKELMDDKRLGIADIVLPSLLKINEESLHQIDM